MGEIKSLAKWERGEGARGQGNELSDGGFLRKESIGVMTKPLGGFCTLQLLCDRKEAEYIVLAHAIMLYNCQ